MRNKDRATKKHNTIMLDGREIVEYNEKRLFEMMGNIKVKIISTNCGDNYWTAELEHNGYKNLKSGRQIHRRNILINKNHNEILVTDVLTGKGKHKAKMNLHIPKDNWNLKKENNKIIFYNNEESFELSNNISEFEIDEDFISELFLNKSPSYVVTITHEYYDSTEIILKIKYRSNKSNA
jgi:hypothetical protein